MRSPLVVPPLLALTLLSPQVRTPSAPTVPDEHESLGCLDLGALEQARSAHHALGREVGRRLGMTTDWARTRWVPGSALGEVAALFHVTVAAPCPGGEVPGVIVDRLQRLGWGGRVTACTEELRIECHRQGCELVLLADGVTITLAISGAGRAVGRTQVLHLIAGVYEDEDVEL